MIGAMDKGSAEVVDEARQKLGSDGVVSRCVSPEEVSTWYAAADVFALGSLTEGFGRVYIEALGAGVPVFCHDFPVARYVNGPFAAYGDLSQRGALATLLRSRNYVFGENPAADRERWTYAVDKFGWPALASRYCEMFRIAAEGPRRV
jgi:glycosyltransferase involved in cell wall biosynthesis